MRGNNNWGRKERECTRYINAIGGIDLYHSAVFAKEGIELRFIKTVFQEYPQFRNKFIPALSIMDVLMFNSKFEIQQMLLNYQLIEEER